MIQGREADNNGDYGGAVALFEEALSQAQSFSDEDPRLTISLNRLSDVYLKNGNPEKALPVLERARSILEQVSPKHPELTRCLFRLARAKMGLSRYEEADQLFGEALKSYAPEAYASWDGDYEILIYWSRNCYLKGDLAAEERIARQLVRCVEQRSTCAAFKRAEAYLALANSCLHGQKYRLAKDYYKRALTIYSEALDSESKRKYIQARLAIIESRTAPARAKSTAGRRGQRR